MAVKFESQFINPYEEKYYDLKNNPLFKQQDWDDLVNLRGQTDLDTYIGLLERSSTLDTDELINDIGFNDMSLDLKFITLSNKLGLTDDTKINKYDVVTDYNSLGKPITDTFDWTEKQYYDHLINEWTAMNTERKLLEQKQLIKDNKSGWEIFWNSVGATLGEVAIGAVETVENVINFADAAVDAFTELIDPTTDGKSNWEQAGEKFRQQIADDETLPKFDEVAAKWHDDLLEWERDNTYYVDIDGNYTSVGKIFGGVAYSIGQQLPTWFIPGGNVAFYASIYESKVQDDFRKYDDAPSVPTMQIISESAISTGLEYGIERGLGKLFGATGSDLLRGISGSGKVSTGIKRWLGDALQEGAEEVLQDFSSWVSKEAASLIYEEYRTDITFEQLWDAAVGGFVASLITGGFAETRQVMYDNTLSKKLIEEDVNYKSLGKEGVTETKEQKTYRQNLLKTAKAKSEIDKATEKANIITKDSKRLLGTKPSIIQRFGTGLSSIVKAFKHTTDGIDITTKQGQKTLAQLNLQLYTGYKAIMDIYGEFGTEKMLAAEKLLQDLDRRSTDTSLSRREYAVASKKFSDIIEKEISSLSLNRLKYDIKKLKTTVKKLEEEKKIPGNTSVDKDALTEIDKIMSSENDELSEDQLKVKSTATTLANLFEQDLVLWNNREIIHEDGTIFAPIEAVRNLSAEEILKSAAEREFVLEYLNAIPQDISTYIVSSFAEFVNEDVSDDVKLEAIYNLLFNPTFYRYLLNRADIRAFNILKSIDNTLNVMLNKIRDIEYRKQMYLIVKRSKSTMGPMLAMYFCNNPNAPLENVTVFTKAQIDFIKEHRLNNENTSNVLYAKYDDVHYLSDTSPGAAYFNAFLQHMGLTVQDIRTDDIDYYLNEFKLFTDNTFEAELDLLHNAIKVSPVDKTFAEVKVGPDEPLVALDDATYAISQSNIGANTIKGILQDDITDIELTYTSLDDIVNNPKKYLTENALIKIKSLFGQIDKNSVIKYIQAYTVNESNGKIGVTFTDRGTAIFVDLANAFNIVQNHFKSVSLSDKKMLKNYANKIVNVSEFIRNDFLLGELKNINIVFKIADKKSNVQGQYDADNNVITIYTNNITNDFTLITTLLHEFNHAVQHFNRLAAGYTSDFVVSKQMISDVKDHLPNLYNEYKTRSSKSMSDEDVVRRIIYENISGEQLSRGKTFDEVLLYPIITSKIKDKTFVNMPWGTRYEMIRKQSSKAITTEPTMLSDSKIITLKEGEKIKSKKSLKQQNDDAVAYQNNVNDALKFAKSKRDNDEPVYKKDLKQFKLPKEIVDKIVNNTYTKSDDDAWQQMSKVISSYKRTLSREKHKKHFEEGKASDRQRALFKKNVEGTNLEYWLEKYPNKIPEVAPEVQEFVIAATNFSKMPASLVNKIKNATLTTRDIYNYVRDAKNINDYTFTAIKNAFFKNTPFNNFAEVKSFVQIVEDAYALKSAMLAIGRDDYIDKTLSWDLKSYKKKFDALKSNEQLSKTVNDTLLRFNVFWTTDSNNKKIKHEMNMADAESDIVLGLLKYFDNTIDSLAYIAGNAKYALQRSITNEQPFTYKQKTDVTGHNTISIDAQLKGKKDTDSTHTVADVIADERQRLEGNSDEDNRRELTDIAKLYVAKLIAEGNIELATKIGKNLAKNIRSMSDDDVENRLIILNTLDNTGISFEDAFEIDLNQIVEVTLDPETEIDLGLKRHNEYGSFKGMINRLSAKYMSGTIYKNLPDEYKKYFDPKNKYRFNPESTKGLTAEQIKEIHDEFKTIADNIRQGEYLNAKNKQVAEKLRKENERLRKENDKLKSKLNGETTTNNKGQTKTTYKYNIDVDVTLESDKPIPDVLQKLFKTTFYEYGESTKKFARIENERNMRVNMKEFFSQNAETLSNLSEKDVNEILEYFESASPLNRDYTPYDAIRVYLLGYVIEQIQDNNLQVDNTILDRCQAMMDGIVRNAARTLSTWKSVMSIVNPNKVIMQSIARSCDLEFTDEEIEPLTKTLKKLSNAKTVKSSDPEHFANVINELKQVVSNLERSALAKYGKKAKGNINVLFDKLLKFQKAMMLSAPATIVRNHMSNFIIGGFDIKGKHIWGMNDVADWIGGLFKPSKNTKTPEKQYDFKGVKVTTETAEFVKKWILDTGLFSLVSDGLSKYDTRTLKAKSNNVEDQLTQMIIESVANRITNQYTYKKGKVSKWISSKGKIGHTIANEGVLNNVCNLIFKAQSDDHIIHKTALKYVGKMLQINNVDLTKGVTSEVMSIIADAYSMAAWDYMHRSNFISDLDYRLRQKYPKTHFALKMIMPFASSSWNWFLESLQMNPVALVTNIYKLNKLERVINNLEERKRLGDISVPDSRFAQMIVKRNIGKGVIGTLLMMVGVGLGALGKIQLDEDDEKLKFKIGDTWIDVSNLFSTSSLLVGAALSQPSEGSFWTVFENALNLQFEDFMLTQLMNTFKYDNTFADYVTSLPTTVINGFIPNVWKSVVRLTNNHTIEYGSGVLGDIQYLAVQSIPFIEYAMPKGIDPYTGEWEEKYSIPAVHQLASFIGSPISFKTYHMSDVEKEFVALGINKQMLKGKYDNLGQLDVDVLNEFYGKLNNRKIKEFVNNKIKYELKNDKGVTVSLYYKQMSKEQKESVLNRITAQNANYAKIFTWTQMGHKYYCSSEERLKLAKLGITKNIFIGTKTGNEKFVK